MFVRANYFKTFRLYKSREASEKKTYAISRADLRRSAVVGGNSLWMELDKDREGLYEVLKWKLSFINTFIESDNKRGWCLKNTHHLEKTEKSSVSFHLGMIFTQAIAQKRYQIRHLHHLDKKGEKRFTFFSLFKKSPDLVGYCRKSDKAYLFESKGSVVENGTEYMDNSNINDGRWQLNSVSEVTFTHTGKDYRAGNLEKLVIATHPVKNKTKGKKISDKDSKELVIQIVDPISFFRKKLDINSELMILKHYFTIMSLLKFPEAFIHTEDNLKMFKDKQSVAYMNYRYYRTYRMVEVPEYSFRIGIPLPLYDFLLPYYKHYEEESFSGIKGIYDRVNKILDFIDFLDAIEDFMYIISSSIKLLEAPRNKYQSQKGDVMDVVIDMNMVTDRVRVFSRGIDGIAYIEKPYPASP